MDDFDPRLGLRSHGGWSPKSYDDVVESVRSKASLFLDCLREISLKSPVVAVPPMAPFPPLHFNSRSKLSRFEMAVKRTVFEFFCSLGSAEGITVLNDETLKASPSYAGRYSLESLAAWGFPYSMDFASELGEKLAALTVGKGPLKGIILDLDNTLWKGILGDDGPDGVFWDLDHDGSHGFGVFQAFVQSLADTGILVAVASKNNPSLVEEIFKTRKDLLLKRDSVFPLLANWNRKSQSVNEILQTWNIASDSVVFVDDSPLEVEEVRSRFPDMKSFVFPADKPDEVLNLILIFRDLYAKERITQEDAIRLESLKQRDTVVRAQESGGEGYEDLLKENNSKVTFLSISSKGDDRAFELLNKTNQFNMNGKRLTDRDWKDILEDPACFALAVSYEDRFGPLGKIAVMTGKIDGKRAFISSWVMSCRAFGRRIEHSLLRYVFGKYDLSSIELDYVKTERNGPFEDFIKNMGVHGSDRKSVV